MCNCPAGQSTASGGPDSLAKQLRGSPVGFLMVQRQLSPCEDLMDAEGILPRERGLVHVRVRMPPQAMHTNKTFCIQFWGGGIGSLKTDHGFSLPQGTESLR